MADFPLAIVTGAAHRIGRAFALCLARRGYAVLLHYHTSRRAAEETAAEIDSLGAPVWLVSADLTTETGIAALFAALNARGAASGFPLRVLVNSAAVMPRADLTTAAASEWDAVLALNLRAPFLLAQAAARRMDEGGLIVNVTDAGAHKLWTGYPAYVVSKSALETLTRLQAKTYAPRLRVNAIAPGLVLPSAQMTPQEWNRLVERLPLQRPAAAGEIAAALDFLLDNASVTGQTISVDGGYSLV
jgi:NAD(P)-dependent dehydrogenase (short-subunit alcohol dehydrogenase family)